MVFANKLSVSGWLKAVVGLLAVFTVASCAVPQKPSPQGPEQVQFESRQNLWQWHDPTHKSFYGLKGPVEVLEIEPLKLKKASPNMDAFQNVGWRLRFNRLGRLMRKERNSDDVPYETIYEYREDGTTLRRIVSYYNGNLWRTSDYIYDGDTLRKVEFTDHNNNDRFSVAVHRQQTPQGWFEIQMPVEKIDVVAYNEFRRHKQLVWSSKGGINNGAGLLFCIRTVDGVTSSSVVNGDTPQMAGQGGYRYRYYDNGLLKAVESYNAHNNELFHTTTYQYNDIQLLTSEQKVVSGDSVFNEADNASAAYDYQTIDRYGNWRQRTVDYQSTGKGLSFVETRAITYLPDRQQVR